MKNYYWIKFALVGLSAFCISAVAAMQNPPSNTTQWVIASLAALGNAFVAMKAYLSEASTSDQK